MAMDPGWNILGQIGLQDVAHRINRVLRPLVDLEDLGSLESKELP